MFLSAGFGSTCNGKYGIDLNGGLVPLNDGRKESKATAGDCCELCKNTEGELRLTSGLHSSLRQLQFSWVVSLKP